MNHVFARQAGRCAEYLMILLLPFYLLHWLNPLISDLCIGEDYQRFPIDIQMELLFSIETGSFPLFVPGALGGIPASSGILGQICHPVSHVSRLMPGYWEGGSLACNTVFRLMSLGWSHLMLYFFLRNIRTGRAMAFLLSLATVYNLRTMELFLYGASLETWTGFIFLIAAIGLYGLRPDGRRGPLLIIGAAYWLTASGHPQMTYYAITGVAIFTLALPFLLQQIVRDKGNTGRGHLRFWMRTAGFVILGVMLAAASWLPFYFEFVKVNTGRIDQPYAWAVMYNDTLVGTANNFFQPLRSGSGAFGGLPLFLAAMLVPALVFFRVKLPAIIWILWGLAIFVFLYMLGPLTPVHYFCWKYVPLVSSFRMAGRISIVMPVLLLPMLIWVVHAPPIEMRLMRKRRRISPLVILLVLALMLMGVYALTAERLQPAMSAYAIHHLIDLPATIEWWAFFWGLTVLLGLAAFQTLPRFRRLTGILVCLLAINQLMILMRFGTWVEPRQIKPTLAEMRSQKKETLDFRPQPGTAGISRNIARHLERFFLEPELARIHHDIVTAADNDDAYVLLRDAYREGRLVVEGYAGAARIPEKQETAGHPSHLKLVYSSFNRLVFEVWTERDGFFLLGYPFSSAWRAAIDGKPETLYRANGYAIAASLASGNHRVEFRYQSFWVIFGILVSAAAYAGIFGFFALRGLPFPWNRYLAASVVLVAAGFFFLWNRSLYHGENLETAYDWTPGPPSPNLAFARDTCMSGHWSEYPELFGSPLAVNGVSKPLDAFFSAGSGFITDLQSEPWWEVDLGESRWVETIQLHESEFSGLEWNRRPIRIGASRDGDAWTWEQIDIPRSKDPITVAFAEPVQLRYLRVQASGFCRLSLSEVEVFPPSTGEERDRP